MRAGCDAAVLYYSPEKAVKTRKVMSVLARLSIRINNITPEQFDEQVGTLAGLEKFPGRWTEARGEFAASEKEAEIPMAQEMLVLCNFTDAALDRLLREMRKSNASVALKAVLTETNCAWTFRELYREVCREHEAMRNMTKKEKG